MSSTPATPPAHREPVIYPRDEHNISRDQIDPDALKIMYRLLRYGHSAFLVGGGVRDLLLNKRPKDFDISTDATPRRIKEIFRNSRIIGRRFKLVHVYFRGNKIIEVSTFRDFTEVPEAEEEGADPGEPVTTLPARDNKYGTEETDALRRDITINGLFYDLSNFSVIDYVGGMEDLRSGIIRVIGDPDVRFPEDPVRMIRVVRHAIRSGFSIDQECWDSLLRNHRLIADVAPVRVYEELKKDLVSGYSLPILRKLVEAKQLEYLLPRLSVNHVELLGAESELARTLGAADREMQNDSGISATVVLSLIAHALVDDLLHSTEDAGPRELHELLREIFADLAVPKKEREKIEAILQDWDYLMETNPQKIRMASFARKPHLEDLITYGKILSPQHLPIVHQLERARESDVHQDSRDNRQRRRDRQHRRRRPNNGVRRMI